MEQFVSLIEFIFKSNANALKMEIDKILVILDDISSNQPKTEER